MKSLVRSIYNFDYLNAFLSNEPGGKFVDISMNKGEKLRVFIEISMIISNRKPIKCVINVFLITKRNQSYVELPQPLTAENEACEVERRLVVGRP